MRSPRSPLHVVWLASYLPIGSRRRGGWLKPSTIATTNVNNSVNGIRELLEKSPMALRLSGQLLLGTVRIFAQQMLNLLSDCEHVLWNSIHALSHSPDVKGGRQHSRRPGRGPRRAADGSTAILDKDGAPSGLVPDEAITLPEPDDDDLLEQELIELGLLEGSGGGAATAVEVMAGLGGSRKQLAAVDAPGVALARILPTCTTSGIHGAGAGDADAVVHPALTFSQFDMDDMNFELMPSLPTDIFSLGQEEMAAEAGGAAEAEPVYRKGSAERAIAGVDGGFSLVGTGADSANILPEVATPPQRPPSTSQSYGLQQQHLPPGKMPLQMLLSPGRDGGAALTNVTAAYEVARAGHVTAVYAAGALTVAAAATVAAATADAVIQATETALAAAAGATGAAGVEGLRRRLFGEEPSVFAGHQHGADGVSERRRERGGGGQGDEEVCLAADNGMVAAEDADTAMRVADGAAAAAADTTGDLLGVEGRAAVHVVMAAAAPDGDAAVRRPRKRHRAVMDVDHSGHPDTTLRLSVVREAARDHGPILRRGRRRADRGNGGGGGPGPRRQMCLVDILLSRSGAVIAAALYGRCDAALVRMYGRDLASNYWSQGSHGDEPLLPPPPPSQAHGLLAQLLSGPISPWRPHMSGPLRQLFGHDAAGEHGAAAASAIAAVPKRRRTVKEKTIPPPKTEVGVEEESPPPAAVQENAKTSAEAVAEGGGKRSDSLGQFDRRETNKSAEVETVAAAAAAAIEAAVEAATAEMYGNDAAAAGGPGAKIMQEDMEGAAAAAGSDSVLPAAMELMATRVGGLLQELRGAFIQISQAPHMQHKGASDMAETVEGEGVSEAAAKATPPQPMLPLAQLVGPGSRRGLNRMAACRLFSDLLILNSTGYVRLVQDHQHHPRTVREHEDAGQVMGKDWQKSDQELPIFIQPTAKLLAGGGTSAV